MWFGGMSRQEYQDFLMENAERIIDTLLDAHSYLLDSIVLDDLQEELRDYIESELGRDSAEESA